MQLALEWARGGQGIEWGWTLAQLPSNERNAALLRREAGAFWALCDRTPELDEAHCGPLWNVVFQRDEDNVLRPSYWRLVRALMPVFARRMAKWHADNTSNLHDWLAMWADVCCEVGWDEARTAGFCEVMLDAIERGCAVLEGAPSLLDDIDTPFAIFARLSAAAGETDEEWNARCNSLTTWFCGGASRVGKWWDVRGVAQKLAYRSRLCSGLLVASERTPTFVRELLPQIEALQHLHLSAELDDLEDELPLADGGWTPLRARFPALELSINDLSEWLRRAENAPGEQFIEVPSGVRALVNRVEKWRREADFLRARLANAPDPHLQRRLGNLEKRLETGDCEVESELADALKTGLETAIQQGLRVLVTRALRGRLRALCGGVADKLEWNDDWANALLLACDMESNRKWATKLLRGQSQNPSGWQSQIPANQEWLEQFARNGANTPAFKGAHHGRIGDWELWIERDALQILQMGNRFSTCLSRGGCNAHSTIANALDANKLVVYARRNGAIEARQLWAVTSDWKLGGFSIYANLSQAERDKTGLDRAFWEFAAQFADACGLELNEDTNADISEICGASWYDDGLISWGELQSEDTSSLSGKPSSRSPATGDAEETASQRIVREKKKRHRVSSPRKKTAYILLLNPLTTAS